MSVFILLFSTLSLVFAVLYWFLIKGSAVFEISIRCDFTLARLIKLIQKQKAYIKWDRHVDDFGVPYEVRVYVKETGITYSFWNLNKPYAWLSVGFENGNLLWERKMPSYIMRSLFKRCIKKYSGSLAKK